MEKRPRRLVAALAVTAGMLLAGCDAIGIGGGELDAATLTAAADTTSQAGTSRFAMASTTSTAGQTFEISGEGAFDYGASRGTITLNVPEVGPTTTIVDGDVVYQQIPQEQAATAGGNWMRIDTSGLVAPDQQNGAGNSDPSAALDWLKGASDDITEVGEEDVRGDAATHYQVVLDLERAATASGQDPAAAQEALQILPSTTIPADVWIDGEGRLRKMAYDLEVSAGGQTTSNSTSFELWDFGTEVTVDPPPADQVVEFGEAIGGAGAGAGEDPAGAAPQDPAGGIPDVDLSDLPEGVDPADVAEFEQRLQEWLENLSEAEREQLRQQFGDDLREAFEQFGG